MAKKRSTPSRLTAKQKELGRSMQAAAPTMSELVASEVAKQIPKVDVGVAVAIPSTIESKMQAICNIAEALKQLAIALNSSNVHVNIEDCHFQNTGMGISIKGDRP